MRSVDWGDGLTSGVRLGLLIAVTALLLGSVVVLVTGDGGTSDAAHPRDGAAGGQQDVTTPTTAPPATAAPTTAPQVAADRKQSGTPTTTTTTIPSAKPGYEYEVILTPMCARVGDVMTATFRAPDPWVTFNLIVFHADADTHDTMWGDTARDAYEISHSWVTPPAPGPAKLLTQAVTPDAERIGGKTIDFRIVGAGEQC